jgi:O-antigen ligase
MKALFRPRSSDILAALPAQCLALSLLFSLISISLSEGFLFLAVVFWAVRLIRDKEQLRVPAFFLPLAVYAALTLVSTAFSVDPLWSLKDCRELALYLMVPIAYVSFLSFRDLRKAEAAIILSAGASMIYSLFYFFSGAKEGERIKGFMGHYMTQAGLLVLFCALALAMVFFGLKKVRLLWAAGFVLAIPLLVLTMTRSAWIGVCIVCVVCVALYKPKGLIVLPILVAAAYFISPAPVKDRAKSIFDGQAYSNRGRLEYAKAGIKIIRDYPFTGTGPDTVEMVFQNPKYGLSEEAKMNRTHLHSNIIQIAAERGIPALLAWLAFIGWAAWDLIRLLRSRNKEVLPEAAAGLAALAALFVSGFFEYNFGDSEIALLFFFLITAPFAARRLADGRAIRATN